MKSELNLKFLLILIAIGLGSLSDAHADGGGNNACQTQEVTTVCLKKSSNGAPILEVTYRGYLLGQGRPVIAEGRLNGQQFEVYLDQQREGGAFLGLMELPGDHGQLEVYFWSSSGNYDSRYGQNYHFNF